MDRQKNGRNNSKAASQSSIMGDSGYHFIPVFLETNCQTCLAKPWLFLRFVFYSGIHLIVRYKIRKKAWHTNIGKWKMSHIPQVSYVYRNLFSRKIYTWWSLRDFKSHLSLIHTRVLFWISKLHINVNAYKVWTTKFTCPLFELALDLRFAALRFTPCPPKGASSWISDSYLPAPTGGRMFDGQKGGF